MGDRLAYLSNKMNGGWLAGDFLVLQNGQRQQQQQRQQQNVAEEQRRLPNSPTTPVWGIVDRIVKEEQPEDRTNDSGVSPDHYPSNSVSPRSRRSSSTANCSLSPGSTTSQDSHVMQYSTVEYSRSPQRLFKSCGSSQECAHVSTTDETSSRQSDQTGDLLSSCIKQIGETAETNQENFQCPICAFTTISRLQFSDHLTSHCTPDCDTPEFVKTVLIQLASQADSTQDGRSEQDLDEVDEPGLHVPRMNSQGKIKKFRCKHCDFVAITKVEFWNHGKIHIKTEKQLTCPKCPFVTEHKHHLEYHLRNHMGSKPFKCDKCSYVCVNKSMLNSHLKSHSNVYQYRCADCTYATKYCHSLKLHLRKYGHQPDMVLNADGSPNPLPIIDVYGTRRGPKQKNVKPDEPRVSMSPNQPPQIMVPTLVAPVNPLAAVSPVNGLGQIQPSMLTPFPLGQVFGTFPVPNQFMLTNNNQQLEQLKSTLLLEYIRALNGDKTLEDYSQTVTSAAFPSANGGSEVTRVTSGTDGTGAISNAIGLANSDVGRSSCTVTSIDTKSEPDLVETKAAPLDLSKSENSGKRSSASSEKLRGTSRRKGKAVKLNRRVLEEEVEEEEDEDDDEVIGSNCDPMRIRTH